MYDDFNPQEEKQRFAELFAQKYEAQQRSMMRLMSLIFTIIGIFFLIGGYIFYVFNVMDEAGLLVAIPFYIIGGVFLLINLMVIVIYQFRKRPFNSEKFLEKLNKNGGAMLMNNTMYLSTLVAVQQEQIQLLSDKIRQLEQDVRRLRNERR